MSFWWESYECLGREEKVVFEMNASKIQLEWYEKSFSFSSSASGEKSWRGKFWWKIQTRGGNRSSAVYSGESNIKGGDGKKGGKRKSNPQDPSNKAIRVGWDLRANERVIQYLNSAVLDSTFTQLENCFRMTWRRRIVRSDLSINLDAPAAWDERKKNYEWESSGNEFIQIQEAFKFNFSFSSFSLRFAFVLSRGWRGVGVGGFWGEMEKFRKP